LFTVETTYIRTMALTQKTVGVIVVLVVIALSGLIVVQTLLLENAFETKEQAFRQNVQSALASVVQQTATSEVYAFAFLSDSTDSVPTGTSFMQMDYDDSTYRFNIEQEFHSVGNGKERRIEVSTSDSTAPAAWVEGKTFHYRVPTAQWIHLQVFDPTSGQNSVLIDTFSTAGNFTLPLGDSLYADGQFLWKFISDSMTLVLQMDNGVPERVLQPPKSEDQERFMLQRMLDRLRAGRMQPVEQRLDMKTLDSAIAMNLAEAGIDLDYAFGLRVRNENHLRFASDTGYTDKLLTTEHRARVFPMEMFTEPAELLLYFPGRQVYLWRQIGPLLIPTAVLMLIIVACFAYTIRTILQQKRFAGFMVDFINNMTHEFKTPLSTVQLACEAINRDDIRGQSERVMHYNQMIVNETRRMRNQADKILQMAVLEEGDYEIKLEEIDIHKIIEAAVDAITLQVENRQGQVECDLRARYHILMADPVHITNVIHNLLDNASKYSPEKPHIIVTTENRNDRLVIVISDNGIGIAPQDTKFVFDKYFRVSQGDRHDVKGFGLGLSYVKHMVEAHHGRVSLTSEPGRGTRVELIFPHNGKEEVSDG